MFVLSFNDKINIWTIGRVGERVWNVLVESLMKYGCGSLIHSARDTKENHNNYYDLECIIFT